MEWEILGHLATATSVGAMTLRSMVKLRILSIIGSLMWVVYGLNAGAIPIVTSSLLFVGVNGIGVYKEIKYKKDVR